MADFRRNALRLLHPTALRGDSAAMQKWVEEAKSGYHPRRLIFSIPATFDDLPGILAQRAPGGDVTAYICAGHTCEPPIHSLDAFVSRIRM